MLSKVTMVVGYPASGKSTLTKALVDQGAISLNRDTEGGAVRDLLPKLENHIRNGKHVVLDNLFVDVLARQPFINMCKAYNVPISCQLMGTSIEDAQFNVVQRAIGLLNGKFPTPEEVKKAKHPNIFPPLVLFKYKKEFVKPTVEEGFSKVETIKFVRKENPEFSNKALILDYDGTLRECINGNDKYPVDESQIEIKPGRTKLLKEYQDKGYLLLGISNQSGIAKGELTADTADRLFAYTNKQLGADIEYRFCSHQSAPISCYCRKPMPGLFVEFMLKYKLNRKECIFVGDMTTDKTFAARAGIQYFDQAEFFK